MESYIREGQEDGMSDNVENEPIERRSLLKSICALPLLCLGGRVVAKPKVCETVDEIVVPEVNSDFPFVGQHWRGRWWRAQGNKIEWTDRGYHPVYWRTDKGFVHWNILPCDFDYCQALVPYRDVLLWVGRREVWEIDYDYCCGLGEFMFQFHFIAERF